MTLSDLDRLIRLETFLCNEPESRREVILEDLRQKSDDELRRLIEEEICVLLSTPKTDWTP